MPQCATQSMQKPEHSNIDNWSHKKHSNIIVLFDVDGTLTPSRKTASPEILEMLSLLKEKVVIGYVGGSDLEKQKEQLGPDTAKSFFDFGFSENGATAFRKGKLIGNDSFIRYIGEESYKRLVNWTLKYLADLDIPVKRGTFIEFRNGMINISPIGRSCTYEERIKFAEFDSHHKIREKMCKLMEAEFADLNLKFSIGGQISIDVFPIGWDKTFCLKHLKNEGFDKIYFFGDKTESGGNDYEIYNHPSVIGYAVKNPQDTLKLVNELFLN